MFPTPSVRQYCLSYINLRIVAEALAIFARLLHDLMLLRLGQNASEFANLPVADMISVPMTLLVPNVLTPDGAPLLRAH
jgi:hypothetical protein